MQQGGRAGQEAVVVRYHADEALELFLSSGAREILNRRHFVVEWRDTVDADIVTQELDPCRSEDTLSGVQDDAVGVQSLQHEAQVREVLFRRGAGH